MPSGSSSLMRGGPKPLDDVPKMALMSPMSRLPARSSVLRRALKSIEGVAVEVLWFCVLGSRGETAKGDEPLEELV